MVSIRNFFKFLRRIWYCLVWPSSKEEPYSPPAMDAPTDLTKPSLPIPFPLKYLQDLEGRTYFSLLWCFIVQKLGWTKTKKLEKKKKGTRELSTYAVLAQFSVLGVEDVFQGAQTLFGLRFGIDSPLSHSRIQKRMLISHGY